MSLIDIMQLKSQINNRTTIDDLVLAIIYKSGPNDVVPKSNACLQKAFFAMREQFHGLLDSISYDCSSFTPYSEELDETLFRLETSTLLSTLNPRYQNYSISGKADLFSKSYDKFSQTDKIIISEFGNALKEIIVAEE